MNLQIICVESLPEIIFYAILQSTGLFCQLMWYHSSYWRIVKFQCTRESAIQSIKQWWVQLESSLPDPPIRWIIKKRIAAWTAHVWIIFSKRNQHCSKRRQRKWWVVTSCNASPFKENGKKSLFFSLKTEAVRRTHVKGHSYSKRKKAKNALETKSISVYKPVLKTQYLIFPSSPVTHYSRAASTQIATDLLLMLHRFTCRRWKKDFAREKMRASNSFWKNQGNSIYGKIQDLDLAIWWSNPEKWFKSLPCF